MKISRELQKKYGSRVMLLAIAVWIVCYIMDIPDIGRGFLLGAVASVINFALLGEFLARRMGLTGRKLQLNIYSSLAIRLVIMAVPLYLGIKFDRFNIFAVIVGLFMIQVMILAHHFKMALLPERGE